MRVYLDTGVGAMVSFNAPSNMSYSSLKTEISSNQTWVLRNMRMPNQSQSSENRLADWNQQRHTLAIVYRNGEEEIPVTSSNFQNCVDSTRTLFAKFVRSPNN